MIMQLKDALKEIEKLRSRNEKLKGKIYDLKEEIDELEEVNEELNYFNDDIYSFEVDNIADQAKAEYLLEIFDKYSLEELERRLS